MPPKHTKDQLTEMEMADLRKVAKAMKVNPAGKRAPDLIREILKKQANAAGKGTAADPKSGKKGPTKAKARVVEDDVDDSDEDEEEEEEVATKKKTASKTPAKKTAAAAKKSKGGELDTEEKLEAILGVLTKVAEFCEIDMPESLGGESSGDDEEAEEEEEEESEEEEEEADEEDSAEEEEEESEEEEEEQEIDEEVVKKASLEQLQEIAQQINDTYDAQIDATITSRQVLRQQIIKFIRENEETENEVEEEDEPKKGDGAPDWLEEGAKVEGLYDGDWYKGEVTEVGKKSVSVYFEDDDSTAELKFKEVRQLKGKKKSA
jgi:Rho termination factor, N-terminal domain